TSGEKLKAGDRNKLLLGASLAKNLNARPGQKILIEQTQVEVAGVFESGNVMQDSSAIMPLRELQDLMGIEGKVTLFLVRVADGPDKGARIESLCREIEAVKDEDGRQVMQASDTRKHVNSSLELRVIKALSFFTSIIALVIGVRHAEHDDDLGVRADARDRHA